MTLELRINLWLLDICFQINSSYECDCNKPMFNWYLILNSRYDFGIKVEKIYDDNYRYQRAGEYNPYFKKWQVTLMFFKWEKIFNNYEEVNNV